MELKHEVADEVIYDNYFFQISVGLLGDVTQDADIFRVKVSSCSFDFDWDTIIF